MHYVAVLWLTAEARPPRPRLHTVRHSSMSGHCNDEEPAAKRPRKEDHRPKRVIAFCKPTEEPYGKFSNYYRQKQPFTYVVPVGSKKGTPIQCEHANTALFCTKASLFKDDVTFNRIREEPDPGECRKLGQICNGFDQKVWDDNIKCVAYEVLRQKFDSDEGLKALLLDTGDDGKTV